MIFSTCPAGSRARVLRATSLTEKTNTRARVLAKDRREPRPRISRWVSIKLHAPHRFYPVRDRCSSVIVTKIETEKGGLPLTTGLPSLVVTAWGREGKGGRTLSETAGETETNRLFGNSVRELATTGTRRVKLFRCLANEIGGKPWDSRLVKTHSTERVEAFRYPRKGVNANVV